MKKIYLFYGVSLFFCLSLVSAQVNMSTSGSYSQNFNTLINIGGGPWIDNSTILNWYSQHTGTCTDINADNGILFAGCLFSYGIGFLITDRALGSIGSPAPNFGNYAHGVLLKNTSSTIITDIKVTYTLEQWRNSAQGAQTVTCWYKISSSIITNLNPNSNGSWTQVADLSATSPITGGTAGALDGNSAANRVTLTDISIPSLNLNNGEYIMFKWDDPDHPGNDHGLAIDDVSLTWTTGALPVELVNFIAKPDKNNVELLWSTASEKNNDRFEIERSIDAASFEYLGYVKGNGTSLFVKTYSFNDTSPLQNISYYRLKQVDFDGAFIYSPITSVVMSPQLSLHIYPIVTNSDFKIDFGCLLRTNVIIDLIAAGSGVSVYTVNVAANSESIIIPVNNIPAGNYFIRIICQERVLSGIIFKIN